MGAPRVDECDQMLLDMYKWRQRSSKGSPLYWVATTVIDGKKTTISLHRLVVGALPGEIVDHIDGDPDNNTRENLRIATASQNQANRKLNSDNVSGYKGVSPIKDKWKAKCGQEYLGLFETPELAARAYDQAAVERWGAYARTNF